jgi:hypothetical protein
MPVSRALRRLLRVLGLEEEQRRIALESAQGELARMERSKIAAKRRELEGRRLVIASAGSGELPDRLAGLEETRIGRRNAAALEQNIADQQTEIVVRRESFLSKRIERRQAETLITAAEKEDAVILERRGQQSLDHWYLNRGFATKSNGVSDSTASAHSSDSRTRDEET